MGRERKNHTFSEKAAAYLDDYDGNASRLLSELVEYRADLAGSNERVVAEHRRDELARQVATHEDKAEAKRAELQDLEELADDESTSAIEDVAADLNIVNPDHATMDNPVIRKAADRNNFEVAVLVEEVARQARAAQTDDLSSTRR